MKVSHLPIRFAFVPALASASGAAFAHPGHTHGTDGFINALVHAFTDPVVLLPLIAAGAYLVWRAGRRPD
jgi:hydrogenase/urease accessory protein HupE